MNHRLLLSVVLFVSACQGYVINKPILGTKINQEHSLSRGLVGVWPFIDRPGVLGRTYDLSGNSNHGDLEGDAHSVPGKFGPALDFDGSSDQVTIEHSSVFSGITEMTLVQWVKMTGTPTGSNGLFSKGTFSGTTDFFVNFESNNTLRLWDNDNQATGVFVGGGIPADTWFQNVLVYVGSEQTIYWYMNGILLGSTFNASLDTALGTGTGGLEIGGVDGLGGYDFNGQIDSTLIYNRALTASEITSLYLDPFQMFEQERLPIASVAAAEEYTHTMIIMGSGSLIVVFIAFSLWFSGRKAA